MSNTSRRHDSIHAVQRRITRDSHLFDDAPCRSIEKRCRMARHSVDMVCKQDPEHRRAAVHYVERCWRQCFCALKIRARSKGQDLDAYRFCISLGEGASSVDLARSATGKKHSRSSGWLPVFRVTCFSPAGINMVSPASNGYSPLSA